MFSIRGDDAMREIFIGREKELADLNELYSQDKFQFVELNIITYNFQCHLFCTRHTENLRCFFIGGFYLFIENIDMIFLDAFLKNTNLL